jgi:hypothetical protein
MRERQAAAVEVKAGDVAERVRREDVDGHVGVPFEETTQGRDRGRCGEHGVDAEPPVLEQALDDEASFGDEQPFALERAWIADEAIGFDHCLFRLKPEATR